MKQRLSKQRMPESMYRASRFCRIAGNPTAYLLIRYLGKTRRTPSEMSRDLGVSVYTVSRTLRHLRQVDIVRYEAIDMGKIYWIKDPEIFNILDSLENWIDRERSRKT